LTYRLLSEVLLTLDTLEKAGKGRGVEDAIIFEDLRERKGYDASNFGQTRRETTKKKGCK